MSAALQNSRNRNRSRQQPVSGRWEVVVMYRYWLNLALGWSLLTEKHLWRKYYQPGSNPNQFVCIMLNLDLLHLNLFEDVKFPYQPCTLHWFLNLETVSVSVVHNGLVSELGESFSINCAHSTDFWAWRKFQYLSCTLYWFLIWRKFQH